MARQGFRQSPDFLSTSPRWHVDRARSPRRTGLVEFAWLDLVGNSGDTRLNSEINEHDTHARDGILVGSQSGHSSHNTKFWGISVVTLIHRDGLPTQIGINFNMLNARSS